MSLWYVPAGGSFSVSNQSEGVDWGGASRGGYDVGNQPGIGDWVWTDGSSQYLGTATNVENGTQASCNNTSGCLGSSTSTIYNDGDIAATVQAIQETAAFDSNDLDATLYFPWYDFESPGISYAYVHITNPGGSAASGTISMGKTLKPGDQHQPSGNPPAQLSFCSTGCTIPAIAAGTDAFLSFPAGTIGGPVTVSSSVPVFAELRTLFNNSLSEVKGLRTKSDSHWYFAWYDHTEFMTFSAIHITATSSDAHVVVTVTHTLLTTDSGGNVTGPAVTYPPPPAQSVTIPAGTDYFFQFDPGVIGGLVDVASDNPIVATMRSSYFHSLTETPAQAYSGTGVANNLYFPWYDLSSTGMKAETIHVANPTASSASVQVSMLATYLSQDGNKATSPPPTQISQFTVPAHSDHYAYFPTNPIGGPILVSSNTYVLATLRQVYYDALDEVPGRSVGATTVYFPWYDHYDSHVLAATIHVTNLSGLIDNTNRTASIQIQLPDGTRPSNVPMPDSLPAAEDGFYIFSSGTYGGPVTITTGGVPAMVSLRYWRN